ncbi:hypothetical protein ACXEHT_004919 [Klebsiella variicola]
MKPDNVVHALYIPFDSAQYKLSDHLSDEERAAISVARRRTTFQKMTDPVPALLHPLRDIALQSGIPAGMASRINKWQINTVMTRS